MANYYFYKGQNDSPAYPTSIRDILQTGNSNIPSQNFVSFPTFTTTNYTKTDVALPFSFKTSSGEIANVYKTQAAYRDYNTSTGPTSFDTYPVWTDKIHIVAIGGGGGKGGNGGCGLGGFPVSRHSGGGGALGAPGQYVAYTGNNLLVTGNFNIQIGARGNNGNNGNGAPAPGSGNSGNDGGQGGSTYINFTGAVGSNTFSSLTIGAVGGGGGAKGNGGNANSPDSPSNNNLTVNNTYPNSINDSNLLLWNTGNGGTIPSPASNNTSSNNAQTPPADYNPANYLNNAGKYQNPGFLRIYFLKS